MGNSSAERLEELVDDYCREERKSDDVHDRLLRHVTQFSSYMAREGGTLYAATSEDVDLWMEGKGWKSSGRRHAVGLLKGFYGWLVEQGRAVGNPCDGFHILPEPPKGYDLYTDSEVRALVREARRVHGLGGTTSCRTYAAFCLNARCGVGWSEMADLNMEDYWNGPPVPRVVISGRREAVVPLDRETAAAIEDYLRTTVVRGPKDPLFVVAGNRSLRNERVSGKRISDSVGAIFKACGIERRRGALHASIVRMALSHGATGEEMAEFLRREDALTLMSALTRSRTEGVLETQDRITVALDSRRPVAVGVLSREELWEAFMNAGECEAMDVTVFEDMHVEFGNFR